MGKKKLSDQKNKDRSSLNRRVDIDNGWTSASEMKIEELGNESAIYSWLHKKSAGILSDRLVRTTLAAAILSAISSAGSFTSIISQVFGEDYFWLSVGTSIIGASISLITTIILIFQKTYDYVGKIEKNKEAEQKYQWTNFKIQGQLQMPIQNRENGAHFFGWISYVINSISHIEDIEDAALESYAKQFPDDAIPGIDGIRKIVIASTSSDSSDHNRSPNNSSEDPDAVVSPLPASPSNRSIRMVTPVSMESNNIPFNFANTVRRSPVDATKQLLTQRRERVMYGNYNEDTSNRASPINKHLQYEIQRGRKLAFKDEESSSENNIANKWAEKRENKHKSYLDRAIEKEIAFVIPDSSKAPVPPPQPSILLHNLKLASQGAANSNSSIDSSSDISTNSEYTSESNSNIISAKTNESTSHKK